MVSRYLNFRYKGFQSISLPSKFRHYKKNLVKARYQYMVLKHHSLPMPVLQPNRGTDGTADQVPVSGSTPNFTQHQLNTNCSQMVEKTKTIHHMKFDVIIKNLLLVFYVKIHIRVQRCRNTPLSLLLMLDGKSPIFSHKFEFSISLHRPRLDT